MIKDYAFQLADIVRETGFAIHGYHGSGHLEKIYENAMLHRLRKQGLKVEMQRPLQVRDEDGTIFGDYFADLVVEDTLIVEIEAAKLIVNEHIAQVLGYLRSARMEHGCGANFGGRTFQIRKLAMSDELRRTS
jgi:GxxExxY protein